MIIMAEFHGSNECTALGETARTATSLCRKLIAKGHDPSLPMHVLRGTTLALRIRSIGEGARLKPANNGIGFQRHVAAEPEAVD